uniref:Uncharacterized protein n=1 Tax=Panagrolaimus sp. JU765 TaxID=591449 RepID=A0AC34R7W8_9BILA
MNESACLASYFGIEVDGKRIVHQYDVNIVYHQEDRGPIGMTGPLEGQPDSGPKGVDDLTRWKNRGIIEKVMGAKVCIYDSARQLFTPTKMKEIKGFRIEKDDLPSDMAATFYGKGYIEVSITKSLEKPSFDIADWSEYDRNDLWRNEDRTWRNFFEVLTTDPAVRRGFIPMKGQIFGPPKDFAAG